MVIDAIGAVGGVVNVYQTSDTAEQIQNASNEELIEILLATVDGIKKESGKEGGIGQLVDNAIKEGLTDKIGRANGAIPENKNVVAGRQEENFITNMMSADINISPKALMSIGGIDDGVMSKLLLDSQSSGANGNTT